MGGMGEMGEMGVMGDKKYESILFFLF